ncbi:MAG: sialate O-acetylesterase [Candidatus Latescibacteria bacterium]|nr:sialate O-acetylesterase [Candidatus Latescibacterota bacterium]
MYVLYLTVTITSSIHSDVTLPGVFGDYMVLQRDMKVPVWGTAEPGEKVSVSINGKKVDTKAEKNGRWMVRLKKMKAGGPYEMTVTGKNRVSFSNVLIGDVWVCSGQSNMAMTIDRVRHIEADIAEAHYDKLRYFSAGYGISETPLYDFAREGITWTSCTPETVKKFSAVAFYFGKELQSELDVPIGLMNASVGGTVLEAWMSRESLKSDPLLLPIIYYWDDIRENWPEIKAKYDFEVAEWEKAKEQGQWVPDPPQSPRGPSSSAFYSCLYNAMITPMIPYGIKGVIWYQGESNTVRAWQHRTQFPVMIHSWRKEWNQGDFPFLFVQLPNWEAETWPIHGRNVTWAEMRESQLQTLSVPNTGMAVTIDIGDEYNAHPNNKWDVGRRLALSALHTAYGREIIYSGPIYDSMKVDGNAIRLSFKHVGDGLVASDDAPLKGFTTAGKDRVFFEATAKIEGDEVVVTCEKVPNPVAVRYGWDDNPECTLCNSAHLPASPFRTDDWPGMTDGMLIPYNRHDLYFWYPTVIR